MIAIINDFDAKLFTFNGIQYVRNFQAMRRGDTVRIMNTYDSRFSLVSAHYSEFQINGNTFGSASQVISVLSPILFVKDELESTAGESGNGTTTAIFSNIFGTWINSPSSAGSGDINLSLVGAVNGGIAAVYYEGAVLTEASFIGGTIVLMSGTNVLNELCIVWIIYDKGSNTFTANIQTGATGVTPPDPSDETSPVITVTDPSVSETSPVITVSDPSFSETSPVITVT